MDLPRYDDLFRPTLEALDALGGSGILEEINDWIAARLVLSDAQLSAVYEKSGAASGS